MRFFHQIKREKKTKNITVLYHMIIEKIYKIYDNEK